MNLFRTSTQRTRSFRIFAALVWGGGLATSPLFAGALSFTDAVERLNTTASTLRTEIFTTPGTLLLAAGDTLARANDALTARIAETLATVDTTAAAAIAATRDTISSSPQLALSLDALKTTLVCFFTTCTTQVPAPAPTPALTTSTTTPKAPTRTVTTSQPKPTTPASTSNLPPTTSNLSAPPLTVTTTQPEVVTKVIQNTILSTTDTTLDAKLAALRAELLAELSRVRQTTSNNYQAISISNRIDSLTDTTLINPTIRNAVITGTSLGATSGSFSGTLSVGGTGTSTFASDVAFDTDTLYIDSLNNRIGIGTSSPSDTLALNGALYLAQISAPSVTANRLYNQSGSLYWNGTALGAGGSGGGAFATTTSQVSGRLIVYPNNATDILTLGASSTTTAPFWFDPNTTTGYVSGNLGIGTTSPYAKLSVSGKGVFSYDDVAGRTGLMVENTSGIGSIMISAPQDTPATLRFGTDGVRRWGIRKTSASENGSNTGADFQIESFDDNGDHYQFPIGIKRSTGDVIISPTASTVNPYARLDVRGAGSGTGQLLEIANSASTTLMRLLDNGTGYFLGNVGIGTTSPYAKLSVVGETVASHFTATSTTATSTFGGAVGIGSTSPFAKFSVTGGAVLFDGTTGATPTSGGGTRFMWVPEKYALRAGGVASTRWDASNIGNYSTAFGYNSIASGVSSFAAGDANQATGANSVALGITSNATGDNSFAAGNGSTATGVNSVALGRGGLASGLEATAFGGRDSTASGDYSVSIGRYVQAAHQSAFAFGLGVDSSNKMTTTEASQFAIGFGGTTPQFVLNGSTGNVGLGTTSPYAKLSVAGQTVADYFTATSTTATSTFANHISVASGKEYRINGAPALAFGSSGSSAVIGPLNTNSATTYSAAIGVDNDVSGTVNNVALGSTNTVSSSITGIAMGYNNTVSGANAIAIGVGITNSTDNSLMIGLSNTNKLTMLSSGNVGIGTTTPVSTLSVQGSLCVRDTGSCGTTAGTIYATTAAISDIDLAENYPTHDRTLSAGEIVAIDTTDSAPEAGVSRAEAGSTVLGIVSTAPGLLLGKEFTNSVPVALAGRVPVKVSLEGGAIHKGDRIMLSSTPGVGMKATTSAYTVGIALDTFDTSSPKDANGIGTVLVFVNLAYSRIDPVVADGSLLTTTSTAGSAQSVTGSAFWNFDDATGRLNFVTPLNLNNFDIVGVRAIRSATNQWSIDEAGKLVVGEVKTNKLCVGETCVDEPILKRILDFVGVDAVQEIVDTSAPTEASDPAPASDPEPVTEELSPAPTSAESAPSEAVIEEVAPPAVDPEPESTPEVVVEPEPTPAEGGSPLVEPVVSSNE